MRADAMNSQDNFVPDDVWPSDDFEFMKMMECKMIGKHNKTEKQKKHVPSSSKDVLSPATADFFYAADGRVQSRGLCELATQLVFDDDDDAPCTDRATEPSSSWGSM
jgi:hypothetical protein